MNIKKELVKLIHYCTSCEECHDADIADHLIANGVTIQRWIPVTEREPRDSLEVLVCFPSGDCVVAVKFGSFWYKGWSGSRLTKDPTHWMPLPATPKEGTP